MKKIAAIMGFALLLSGCAILNELTALTKCEFKFHSAENPVIAGINVSSINSYSDLSFMDGQRVVTTIMQRKLPFEITANVEVKNPGMMTAAVNQIEWIAYIDDIEISRGRVDRRIEIQPNSTTLVPILIDTDLFQYLEGDNPKTMLNFGLNLVDAGGQPTRLSMKIKPSVNAGGQMIPYPDYFTITHVFKSGS